MDTIKKLLLVLAKILGVLLIFIGALGLLRGIVRYVPYLIRGVLYFSEACDFLLTILVIYIGFRLLCLRKTIYYISKIIDCINKIIYYIKNREQIQYQKEQRRHEAALEKAEQLAYKRQTEVVEKNNGKQKSKEKIEACKLKREGYVDIPDKNKVQKIQIHLCAGTDTVWKIIFIISIVLTAGSLLTIPIFCAILSEEYMGILACGLTVTFWGGGILLFIAQGYIDGERNIVLVTTDQKVLYKMDLNLKCTSDLKIPITWIGRIIYFSKLEKESKVVQEKRDNFLKDRKAIESVLDEIINPRSKDIVFVDGRVKKLNSPILVDGFFRTYIEYWDESEAEWVSIPLPKKTEGYDKIYEMIKNRNIKKYIP